MEASLIELRMIYTLGWSNISSADGLRSGFCSIIKHINCSSYIDRLALGENLITPSPACLSFYHMTPFWGKLIPVAISSNEAPRLNISAFVLILLVGAIWVCKSSGAIKIESPSTSSSFNCGIFESSKAYPKSPKATEPFSLTKKLEGLTSRWTNPKSCTCFRAHVISKRNFQT